MSIPYPAFSANFTKRKNSFLFDCLNIMRNIAFLKYITMIDLNDVTIVIPVRIDSKERTLNLDAQIAWLSQKNIQVHVMVLEADAVQSYYLKNGYERVSYYFYKDLDPVFYRTHYLNILLEKANTSIVGIWDVDVFLSLEQMFDAVARIREKKAVMAIPYDGRVYSVNSEISQMFRGGLDLKLLEQEEEAHQLLLGTMSVGAAVFVDREGYLNAGGENERFYG